MIATPSLDELRTSGQNLLQQRVGITNFDEGSVGGALVELHAQYTNQMYTLLAQAEAARDLEQATGQDLDNLGRSLGGLVRRAPIRAGSDATAAQLLVTNTSNAGISMPKSTQVWSANNPNQRFSTNNNITVPPNSSVTVFIKATLPGSNYNVSAGQLNSHNADSSLLVSNVVPVQGGSLTETDDEFRYRISQSLKSAIMGGKSSPIGVTQALLQLPGVVDVILQPLAEGPGTLNAIVVPETGYQPDDDFLTSATEEMARVAAAGISVKALAPMIQPVNVDITINAKGQSAGVNYSSSLRNLITNLVSNYINTRTVQVNAVPGVVSPYGSGTDTSESMISYNDLKTQITNAAQSVLGSQIQGVVLILTVGSSTDQAIQGDLYARNGEVFRSRSTRISINFG